MEKKVCHYPLDKIKKLIIEEKYYITRSAMKSAIQDFAFMEADILNEILFLSNNDFYKSMTSHADHKLWQDVYKKQIKNSKVYIKVQITNDSTVIISFKNEVEL